ncbi:UL16-binding protein 2-like [Lemur catta]|uniref:UL16-binding protein 2-like n=1 Tax=Lemur catta TaxID=9447 RepID=UPI001E2668BE|nr:UL16-binding protein 2-like [Lemur catta]
MAPAADSELGLTARFLGLLLLLPGYAWAGQAETHTLSYNFTITPKFTLGQQWCEVQGQVDGKIFLRGNCGDKNFEPCDPLGKEIYGTKAWKDQLEILINVVEELRKKLLDFQLENHTSREPLTVEVRMSCQREANRHTNGSWQFGFHGQVFLVFDSENRSWILAHPGARQMKEKWENNTDVTMFFHNILIGDCKTLLTNFLTHWEKLLQPTERSTEGPGTAQPKARATRSICYSLTLFLPCFILLAI